MNYARWKRALLGALVATTVAVPSLFAFTAGDAAASQPRCHYGRSGYYCYYAAAHPTLTAESAVATGGDVRSTIRNVPEDDEQFAGTRTGAGSGQHRSRSR